MNNEAKLEPKRNPNPSQIYKMKEKKSQMESQRRQKRSRNEKRIQEASGVLRPGTLESLLGSLRRIFLTKININQHKKRKSDVPEGVSKKHEILIRNRYEKVPFREA